MTYVAEALRSRLAMVCAGLFGLLTSQMGGYVREMLVERV